MPKKIDPLRLCQSDEKEKRQREMLSDCYNSQSSEGDSGQPTKCTDTTSNTAGGDRDLMYLKIFDQSARDFLQKAHEFDSASCSGQVLQVLL